MAATSLERVTEASEEGRARSDSGAALNRTRWNRKQAARVLGVDYKALLYKMKKHDISRDFEDDEPLYIAGDSVRSFGGFGGIELGVNRSLLV